MATTSTRSNKGQGLAIAALVLGIVSIVIALLWFISMIVGVLAVVFGAVSLKTAGRGKALAGIITGSIGIVLSIVILALIAWTVPILQQSQRDTVRKNDVAILATDVITYSSDHRGQMPQAGDLATDSLGSITAVMATGDPTTSAAVYQTGVDCNGAQATSRSYAISILLENGSVYCQEY